ncbi:MAG: ABC transporter permease, partial [Thermodesulfobacteriota bacterium]
LISTMLVAVGLGWILSSVNVCLRDMEQVLGLLMMGWLFFTPILYSPGIVPDKALLIMKLNPLYHMVEGYRLALLTGDVLPWGDFLYLAISSVVVFGLGGVCFKRLKPWFAEVL